RLVEPSIPLRARPRTGADSIAVQRLRQTEEIDDDDDHGSASSWVIGKPSTPRAARVLDRGRRRRGHRQSGDGAAGLAGTHPPAPPAPGSRPRSAEGFRTKSFPCRRGRRQALLARMTYLGAPLEPPPKGSL